MDRLRARLEALVPAYEAGTAHRDDGRSGRLELVTDLGAVRGLIAEHRSWTARVPPSWSASRASSTS